MGEWEIGGAIRSRRRGVRRRATLLRQLAPCEIDLASRPFDDATLTIRDLFSEELRLALPPGHRLAPTPSPRSGPKTARPRVLPGSF